MTKRAKRISGCAVAIILVLVMAVQLFTPATVLAACDSDTMRSYESIFPVESSKETGFIWSDKTVTREDQYISGTRVELEAGEDFNVVYSAIGSALVNKGQKNAAYPTDVTSDPDQSGYVTYTDYLGPYMQVNKIKHILLEDDTFSVSEPVTEGNKKIYHGVGMWNNPAYNREIDLKNIIITVTTNEDHSQILELKIPATLLPLLISEIDLTKDGSIKSYKRMRDENPIRLVYSVGMDQNAEDLSNISQEYINNNTKDGKLDFYSSLYTGKTDQDGRTIGDAFTQFTPASDNPSYYYQQNIPIFHDKEFKNPVKSTESFQDESVYYLKVPYYKGNRIASDVDEITGAGLNAEAGQLIDEDGIWALKKGSTRDKTFTTVKEVNTSGTAELSNATSMEKVGNAITSVYVNHGNNGKIQVEGPKDLVIKKTVKAQEGTAFADQEFTFHINIPSRQNKSVIGKISSGTEEKEYRMNFDNKGSVEVRLKDGDLLTIPAVFGDYTVEEVSVKGYETIVPENAKGTIGKEKNEIVEFIDNYQIQPLTVDQKELGFPITLSIPGYKFAETDQYSFQITGPEGAMPEHNTAVIDGSTVVGKSEAQTDFGKFIFTKPGIFEYNIKNLPNDGQKIPGIHYSDSEYMLRVNILDNGDGTLSKGTWILQEKTGIGSWADRPNSTIRFINTFDGKNAEVMISGSKVLENMALEQYPSNFTFRIQKAGEDALQPMPETETATVNAKNGSIEFKKIKFTMEDVGKTYKYIVTEEQPTTDGTFEGAPLNGAVKDETGKWVYRGVTFDNSKKEISIEVTQNKEGPDAILVPVVKGNDFTFTGTYHAEGNYNLTFEDGRETVVTNIKGREFKKGDKFVFDITSECSDGTKPLSGKVSLPEKITIKPSEGSSYQEMELGNLHFDLNDVGKVYTYTITERKGELNGIQYDTVPRKVILAIHDNYDGTLRIERTGDTLEWTNEYKATWPYSDGYDFTGSTTIAGMPSERGLFMISVTGLDGAPLGDRADSNNRFITYNGDVEEYYMDWEQTFSILDGVIFTSEDLKGSTSKQFVYEIRQIEPEKPIPGMIYDDSLYRLCITVYDDMNGLIKCDHDQNIITKQVSEGVFEKASQVIFKNTYQPESVSVVPFEQDGRSMIRTQLTGMRNENLKADEFNYSFELKNASAEDGVEIINHGPAGNQAAPETAEDKNLGDISFEGSTLTFKKAGTYVFTVKQDTVKSENIVNTTPEVEITYTVEDVDGQLTAVPSYTGTVTNGVFVNEYKTEGILDLGPDGNSYLQVEKILKGREWQEQDAFHFTLTAKDHATAAAIKDGAVVLSADQIVIKNSTPEHKASFGKITFKQPGAYEFRISETGEGILPGTMPDVVSRIVKVTAADHGNGTMDLSYKIMAENDPEQTAEKNNLVFTSEYKTGETVLIGKDNLNVKKILKGRSWMDSDAFTFTLSGGDPLTKQAIGTDILLPGRADTEKITVTDRSVDQTEYFGNIIFKKAGNYVFDIVENAPETANVSYVTEPKKLHINVEEKEDGTLTAAVNAKQSDKLEFVNTYAPNTAVLNGEKDLVVTTELNGREWREEDSFRFQIQPYNDPAKNPENVVMPEQTVLTVNGSTKTGHFDNITFKKAGRYEFEITGQLPEGVKNGTEGLNYDLDPKKIIVDVTDDQTGKLTVQKDEEKSDKLVFVNEYVPEPLKYDGASNLKVQTVLNGREWQKGDTFTFSMTYDHSDPATEAAYGAGDFVLPQNVNKISISYKEGTPEEDHTAAFGDIIFKKAGVYQFNIQQNKGNATGMTYDYTGKTVTVTVSDDGHGKLTASQNPVSIFTNTYASEAVTFSANDMLVRAELTGRSWEKTDKFTFKIRPKEEYEEGSFEMGSTECTITGDMTEPTASFGDITFFKPSTDSGYQFIISEVIPSNAIPQEDGRYKDRNTGITYEGSEKRISIYVGDDNKGKLYANVLPGRTDESIFCHEYQANPLVIMPVEAPNVDSGMIGIPLQAVLTGREWKDTDEFTFKIEALDGAPSTSKETAVVKNTNDLLDFGILSISHKDMGGAKEKIFRYKVTEVIPENKEPGLQYCETPVIFKVKVSDNGKGFLIAGDGSPDSGLVLNDLDNSRKGEFVNTYTSSEAKLSGAENLKVHVDFTGREKDQWLESDQFEFRMSVKDPITLAAVQKEEIILPEHTDSMIIKASDDPKEKAFGDIIFKTKGEYQFTVEGINQNIPGISYAPEQTITVDVTDDLKGQLIATVREGTALLPFTNTYAAGNVTLSGSEYLKVTTQINGREWKDGDSFTYNLSSGDAATTEAVNSGMIQMPGEGKNSITITGQTNSHSDHFGNIVFKKSGNYKFKLEQKIPDQASVSESGLYVLDGLYYDPAPYMIDVEVLEEGEGQLKINTAPKEISMIHDYKYGTATLNGSENLHVKNVIYNRYYQYGEEFEYAMIPANELAKQVVLPGNITVSVMEHEADGIENGTEWYQYGSSFGDMTFDEPGIYEFNVIDVISDQSQRFPGTIYDTEPKKLTVKVTDNLDGTLSASTDLKGVTFKNTYQAKPAYVLGKDSLNVEINLSKNGDPGNYEFEFRMVPTKETLELNTPEKTAFEMSDAAKNGLKVTMDQRTKTVNFGDFVFYKPGSYNFDIYQVESPYDYIATDTTKYHACINVYDYTTLGELAANVNLTSDVWDGLENTMYFSVGYHAKPVTLEGTENFRIDTSIKGRDWIEGDQFTFKLERIDRNYFGDATVEGPKEITIAYNKDGNYTANFGNITFKGIGLYEFKVTEVIPENKIPGITYATYDTFKINVTEDNEGRSYAELISPSTLHFVNRYSVEDGILSGEENLRVKTSLEGKSQWTDTDEFTFELSGKTQETRDAIKDGTIVMNQDVVTINKDTPEFTANFGDITFRAPGSYVFEVSEKIPEKPSSQITYDKSKKTIVVEVADNMKGRLEATVSDTISVFTNEYKVTPAVLNGAENLTVTKVLKGRDWMKGDTFSFHMAGENEAARQAILDGNIILPENSRGITITEASKPEKTANFDDITFKTAGTYTFRITEKAGSIKGIDYDPTDRILTVVVNDNGKGTLNIEKTEIKADGMQESREKDNLTFTNTYSVQPVTVKGSRNLVVENELKGRDWTEADSFKFKLTADPSDDATVKAVQAGTVVLPANAGELAVTKDAGSAAFGDLIFKKNGTYKFTIQEILPEDSVSTGITYAPAQNFTVHVKDNLDGTMTAESSKTIFKFVNTYDSSQAQLSGKDNLKAEVILEGRPWAEETFTLQLTQIGNPDELAVVENGKQTVTVTKEDLLTENKAETAFEDLTFKKAGNYVFELSQKKGDKKYIAYDDHKFVISVKVEDNGKGQLIAKVQSRSGQPEFVNTYAPAVLSGQNFLKVEQILKGREWKDTDRFSYTLRADKDDSFTGNAVEKGTVVLPKDIVIDLNSKNTKAGKTASFGDLTFDQEGTYKFEILENNSVLPGITCDQTVKKITVQVKEDPEKGTLKAEAKAETYTFTNIYKAAKLTIGAEDAFVFTGALKGREWGQDETFTFTLAAAQKQAPMPEQDRVVLKKPAHGSSTSFNFGSITITSEDMADAVLVNGVRVKTFVYEVSQTVPEDTGSVNYDRAVRTVTITVTDNGDGKLALQGSITTEGEKAFTNIYSFETTYGEASKDGGLTITTNMTNHELADKQIGFRIEGMDQKSKEKLNEVGGTEGVLEVYNGQTAMSETVAKWSTKPLDAMKFVSNNEKNDLGVYSYRISQKPNTADGGYTYDDTEYEVSIHVESDANGILTVTTENANVVFNNRYDAEGILGREGTEEILADVTLTGRPIAAGEFQYQVINLQNGEAVATGSNTEGNTIVFDPIHYSADTMEESGYSQKVILNGNAVYSYSYQVKQLEPEAQNITTVTDSFTITVKAADDGNGNILPEVVYPEGTGRLSFVNEYEAAAASVDITAGMTLKAEHAQITQEDLAGRFHFLLEGVEAEYIPAENGEAVSIPLPETAEATNDRAGNISFGTITYDLSLFNGVQTAEDGSREITFTYSVKETDQIAGITNDPESVKYFTVKVTENGLGMITAEKTGDVSFAKEYHMTPITTSPTEEGALTLTGVMEGRALAEAEMVLEMTDPEGTVVSSGKNNAEGIIAMSSLTFETPGVYEFTLKQAVSGSATENGVTPDTAEYKVQAVVTDCKDGTLQIVWTIGEQEKEAVFTNRYETKATSVTLGAVKILSGRTLKAGEFSFLLTDAEGKVLQTVKNDKEGRITFEPITYGKTGTWNYTISEVKGSEKNMSYDETQYHVTVNVTDNGMGFLKPEVTVENEIAVIFHNVYVEEILIDKKAAEKVEKQISGLKVETLEDKKEVEEARKAYEDLTDIQKKLVGNLDVLEQAEAQIRELEKMQADTLAAKAVEKQISSLKVETLEDKKEVEAARKAYEDLTEDQKKLVGNLDTLVKAEEKIAYLDSLNKWVDDGEYKGYVKGDGTRARSEVLTIDGKIYYFDADAHLYTQAGFKEIDGSTYLIGADGAAAVGFASVDRTWYLFDESGKMLTDWQQVDGYWYYLEKDGAMVKGWKNIGSHTFYFNGSGHMLTGWQAINGKWYYFYESGRMLTGWQQIDGYWYYLEKDGAMTKGWKTIGNNTFYFNGSGHMATGWQAINGKWYYFYESGRMLTGWQKIDGYWYYLRSNGEMAKGWLKDGSHWFYFDGSGHMVTGKRQIDGKWYTFRADGALI